MNKKRLFGILMFGVLGFVLFKYIFIKRPCLPPEKPIIVPKAAVWKGDCDGGSWIELVSIGKDKVRFRIYRDWNGDLILDADFEYQDCNTFYLTESNWAKYIAYFGNALEVYDNSTIQSKCKLVPVYPAYKEEILE